jgi:hypothetical protein
MQPLWAKEASKKGGLSQRQILALLIVAVFVNGLFLFAVISWH